MDESEHTGDGDDADEAVADASMALSTAEGRVEYASVELESTRDAVGDVADTDLIGSRLEGLDAELQSLDAGITELQDSLQRQIKRRNDPEHSEEVLRELDRIQSAADSLQAQADQLVSEASNLERLVEDPTLALGDLRADVDELEAFLEDIEATLDQLTAVLEDDISTAEREPAAVWFEATVRHRFRSLAVQDIRAELQGVRELTDDRSSRDAVAELQQRLDAVENRWDTLGARLADIARVEWVEQYENGIEEAESTVAEFTPPIDWEAAGDALDEVLSGQPKDSQ